MTHPAPDDTSEKPLDPAVLRVQKRVTRLMLIAALTFGIGLVIVLGAMIYRLSAYPDKSQAVEVIPPAPEAAPIAAATAVAATPQIVQATPSDSSAAPSISAATSEPASEPASSPGVAKAMESVKAVLPARAWLVSASISGDRIVLAYEHANGTTMFVVDAKTLAITGRLDLKPE